MQHMFANIYAIMLAYAKTSLSGNPVGNGWLATKIYNMQLNEECWSFEHT